MLMKIIKDDVNGWKDIPYFWIETIYSVKMNILYKAIYRFQCNPYQSTKIPMVFFKELEQKKSETQKTSNSQSNLEKEKMEPGELGSLT